MEFKGTKGKWKVSKKTNINEFNVEYFTIDFESSEDCIDIYADNRLSEKERIIELKANALLISKAPEMLEMLMKVNNKLKGNGFPMLQSEIEQLIKEATEL